MTTPDKFWSKVLIADSDDCWPWQGKRTRQGYGMIGFEGRAQPAHRIAYIFYFSDFDRTLDILHKCDNPPCCNPHHLFVGTHSENMQDAVDKGRLIVPHGKEHYKVILTEDDVRRIRDEWKPGYGNAARLARAYNVSQGCIWGIVTGRNWKCLL